MAVQFVCDRCGAPAQSGEVKSIKPVILDTNEPFDKVGTQPVVDLEVNISIVPQIDLCPTCLPAALLIRLKQLGA